MQEFSIKPKILFGDDSLSYLKELPYKKYMIVTDKIMVDLNITEFITKNLPTNYELKIFSEVEANPTLETVKKGMYSFFEFEPECIIALGGGSPIDACKAILYFGYKANKQQEKNRKAFFIAVPTTSGSGSEATSYSVITDDSKKIVLINSEMLPDIAILNSVFMDSLPKKIIADTGMDVLTHAIESFVSKERNYFSNAMAMQAIKLIFENLLLHFKDIKLKNPKENVQYASCLAGVAFDNSGLGVVHSIAHSIGARFHIAHGRANAVVLPYVIAANTDVDELYCEISSELKLPSKTVKEGKRSIITCIEMMKEIMDIEKSLQCFEVDFEEYKKQIPNIIKDIKADICTKSNPNNFTDEDYVRILLKIYFGNN